MARGRRSNYPEYEFSKSTVIEALKRANFTCENCGTRKLDTPEKYLEIHHLIYVWYAIDNNIPHAIITSVENAMCLCHSCHVELHRAEPDIDEFEYLLAEIALHLDILLEKE